MCSFQNIWEDTVSQEIENKNARFYGPPFYFLWSLIRVDEQKKWASLVAQW